jgi:diadenylate cyclase
VILLLLRPLEEGIFSTIYLLFYRNLKKDGLLSHISSLLLTIRLGDYLDIAVITVAAYFLLTWLLRRTSRSIIIGCTVLLLLYGLAHHTHMYVTLFIFQAGFTAALVILAIAFQDDIRAAIERVISWKNYRTKYELVASAKTTDILVETIANLANDKIGALVVIKGRQVLDRHLSGGISLNGRLSLPLLYSIFHPNTPSHDGAVIVEGDRIEKFAVRLPLSHNLREIGDAGTRHTAGLGMSEHSDTLVIIVSEERGTISVAENGRMELVGRERLRNRIQTFYEKIFPSAAVKKQHSWITNNALLKVSSLCLAIILWLTFAYRTETVSRTFMIPVEYRNVPPEWIIEAPVPSKVQVSLSGMERAFNFDASRLALSLNVSNPKEEYQTLPVSAKDVNMPSGLKVSQLLPHAITLHAYKLEPVTVPVKVNTRGRIQPKLTLSSLQVHPDSIKILIRKIKNSVSSEIFTEPLLLENIYENTSLKLKLHIPEGTHLVDETQNMVKVTVEVEPRKNKK